MDNSLVLRWEVLIRGQPSVNLGSLSLYFLLLHWSVIFMSLAGQCNVSIDLVLQQSVVPMRVNHRWFCFITAGFLLIP